MPFSCVRCKGVSRMGLTRERYFVPTVVHGSAGHARVRMVTDRPSLQGPSRCLAKRQTEDKNHENERRENKAMTTDVHVENVPRTHENGFTSRLGIDDRGASLLRHGPEPHSLKPTPLKHLVHDYMRCIILRAKSTV